MASLRVRIDEGSDKQPNLLWDSVWAPWSGQADWKISGTDEPFNRGGLSATKAIHTAVIIALFTDRFIEKDHPLRYLVENGDPRGWFGDGDDVRPDLGEGPLGSLLWLFERAPLTDDIRRWVEALAIEALAPLIFQRVAVRIEAQAYAQFAFNRVDLAVQIYGRDGAKSYDYRFDDLWKQIVEVPPPPKFTLTPPP